MHFDLKTDKRNNQAVGSYTIKFKFHYHDSSKFWKVFFYFWLSDQKQGCEVYDPSGSSS